MVGASADPPAGVDWGCGFTRTIAPDGIVYDSGPPTLYLQERSEAVDAQSHWQADSLWVLPRTGTSTGTGSLTSWKLAADITTSLTVDIQWVVEEYSLESEVLGGVNSSASGCVQCGTESGTPTDVSIYVEYRKRATYAESVDAFYVRGASSTYAAWTVEVAAGDLVVRDGGGAVQYTWSLAAYSLGGLRTAVNATPELVASGGAVGASSAVSTAPATHLKPKPVTVVTDSAFTAAPLYLREVGDEVETYQAGGAPQYFIQDDLGEIVVKLATFTGSESAFASGYEYRWSAGEIESGDAIDWARAGASEPYAALTYTEGSVLCDNGAGTLYEPPLYVPPDCPEADPVGMPFSSLPTDGPFAMGDTIFSPTVHPRTADTQEASTESVSSTEDPSYPMHVCGTISTTSNVAMAFENRTYWAARAIWQLTRYSP